jgi:signal transduction histidine kinase
VLTIRLDQLRAEETTPAPVAAVLEQLRAYTSELTDDVHGLSHRLHSSALDYLGLVPALHKLTNECTARHGIQVTFSHDRVPAPLPSAVALSLFRVAEESLANMVKHSQATSAHVIVIGDGDGITLSIRDNGKGFEPSALEPGAGLGFLSMRERLRALGGTVRVDSAPGHGTTIEARVPAARRRSRKWSRRKAAPSRATPSCSSPTRWPRGTSGRSRGAARTPTSLILCSPRRTMSLSPTSSGASAPPRGGRMTTWRGFESP